MYLKGSLQLDPIFKYQVHDCTGNAIFQEVKISPKPRFLAPQAKIFGCFSVTTVIKTL